jgi:hypothetical protein
VNTITPQTAEQLDYHFTTPRPVARRSSKRTILMAAAALALALIGFGGGYAVANATAAKPAGRTFAGVTGQGAGGAGGASGTVASVSSSQMTVTTQAGGSKLVLLSPTTTVTQVTSSPAAISAIANGNQVTVIGTTNPDGSVTATQVVIGNAGAFGRNRESGAGGASPAASTAP